MVKPLSSNFQPSSVLDRLIDQDPEKPEDSHFNRKDLVEQLIDGVQRDLSNLLNTRKRFLSFPRVLKELDISVISYGMEDFANYLSFSDYNQETLRADIEKTVSLYETRLRNIKVTLEPEEDMSHGVIQFNIEGQFNIKEILYPLFVRITLNTETNAYKLREAV